MSPVNWAFEKADRNEAYKKLRYLLRIDAPIRMSKHFRERAKERKFSFLDAQNILNRGQIIREGEFERGSYRYRIQTNKMFVVFAFDEKAHGIILITAHWLERGKSL